MSAAPTIPIRPTAYAAGYAVRDVARLTGLAVPQILGFVRAGTVAPRRGPRREYRFSFQDLVVLRTARDLLAKVSPRKLHRALRRLREQLPNGRQLATVRIAWEGDELVVQEGTVSWNPESGQALLDLDVASLATEVAPFALRSAAEAFEPDRDLGAEDWYLVGCELEPHDPARAQEAYRRALDLQPGHADAGLNLGRLLHEAGRVAEAEACYRRALEARPGDATAAFNLGVALQDLGRFPDAVAAYEQALESDAAYADAHYNLSQLHERLGHGHAALRHLQAYRGLRERHRAPTDPD